MWFLKSYSKHRLCNMLCSLIALALIPTLIFADTTCPDGKISCPQSQECCYESGHYTCCEKVEDEDLTLGVLSTSMRNMSLNGIQNVPATEYCPFTSGRKLCCNPPDNCLAFSDCCNGFGACCMRGLRCCGGGQWCCLNSQKCGPRFNTCRSAGMTFIPAIGMIALLALVAVKIHIL